MHIRGNARSSWKPETAVQEVNSIDCVCKSSEIETKEQRRRLLQSRVCRFVFLWSVEKTKSDDDDLEEMVMGGVWSVVPSVASTPQLVTAGSTTTTEHSSPRFF